MPKVITPQPQTWDASASSQQIYDTTTRRLNGRKVTVKTLLLNLVTQSLYPISRITIGSSAAVFGVSRLGLWPCPNGATIYKDSYRVGETAVQQIIPPSPGPHGHRKKCPQECKLWSVDRTQVPS